MTSVDPGMVRRGDDVTIIGEGFGESSELVDVHLGDTPCNVSFVNDTLIICTVQSASSGPKPVQVLVSPAGRAAILDLFVDYNVTIDGISPSDVSLGGGSMVEISGSGFLGDECRKMSVGCECSDVSVLIGGVEATVVSSSETEIVCTVPPSITRAEETVSVTVLIGCDDGSVYSDSLVDGISYQNNSAVITSIEPVEGTAGGGTVVNIAGQNLPTNSDDVTVMVSVYVRMCMQSTCTFICTCFIAFFSIVYCTFVYYNYVVYCLLYMGGLQPCWLLFTVHGLFVAMLSTVYCTWVVCSHVGYCLLYMGGLQPCCLLFTVHGLFVAMLSTVYCTWVVCSHVVYCLLYMGGL